MARALQIYCKIILNRLSSCQKLIKYVPLVGGGGLCVCACPGGGGGCVSLGGSVWLHLEGPRQPAWCLQLWPPAPGWNPSRLQRQQHHCPRLCLHGPARRLPAAPQALPQAARRGYHWGGCGQAPGCQLGTAKGCASHLGHSQRRKIGRAWSCSKHTLRASVARPHSETLVYNQWVNAFAVQSSNFGLFIEPFKGNYGRYTFKLHA